MSISDNISELAKLLGEKNEKRLKEEFTDIIIERFRDDIENYDMYLIDYDKMFSEIEYEVTSMVKEKIRSAYMEQANKKIAEFLAEH